VIYYFDVVSLVYKAKAVFVWDGIVFSKLYGCASVENKLTQDQYTSYVPAPDARRLGFMLS